MGESGFLTVGTLLGVVHHVVTAKAAYSNKAFGDESLIGHWDDAELIATSKAATDA